MTFVFYKKNHKIFPEECESFLRDRIEKELNQVGDRHYEIIAESLNLMKKVNPERTGRIANEIRANFKKRRNLIKMIKGF